MSPSNFYIVFSTHLFLIFLNSGKGNELFVSKYEKTNQEAKVECEKQRGRLLILNNKKILQTLRSTIGRKFDERYFHIGLTLKPDGTTIWSNNQRASIFPVDIEIPVEKHTEIYCGNIYTIGRILYITFANCKVSYRFICEVNLPATPSTVSSATTNFTEKSKTTEVTSAFDLIGIKPLLAGIATVLLLGLCLFACPNSNKKKERKSSYGYAQEKQHYYYY